MNFYDEIKPKVEEVAGPYFAAKKEAFNKLQKTQARVLDEQETLKRKMIQRERLLTAIDSSLTDTENNFQKFKVSLKKVDAEIQGTQEIIEALESRVIPAMKSSLSSAEAQLRGSLDGCHIELVKNFAEPLYAKPLDEILEIRDGFLDAMRRIFTEHGCSLSLSSYDKIPTPRNERVKIEIIPPKK